MNWLTIIVCVAIGAGLAGGMYWLVSRALYRGSWPWLDSISENTVKMMVMGCAALAGAWIFVFAVFMASR